MPATFVIVGAGQAGGTAAAVLREEGFAGTVILIGVETHPPYERPPLSKQYLRGELPFEQTLVRPAGVYAEQGVQTSFGVRATRVDPAAQVVELAGGERVPYNPGSPGQYAEGQVGFGCRPSRIHARAADR